MSVLLDTHVLVWSAESPEKLGKRATSLILDTKEALYVSSVTTLEIARLSVLRQLELSASPASWCQRARAALGAISVAVDDEIAAEAYALPGNFHADPADRILVAAARARGFKLMTSDARILAYGGVRTIDARK